jgi:hypothetical protein
MIFVLSALFFASIVYCPWWVTLFIAIWLAPYKGSFAPLVIGGLLMDVMFGSRVASLGGFSYVYTLVFVGAALVSWYLREQSIN